MRTRGFSTGGVWKRISTAVGMANHLRQGPRLRILVCSNLFPPSVVGGAELVAYRHAKVLQEWGHDVRIFCGRLGDAATARYQITVERGEFPITRVSLSPRDLSGDLWHYDNRQITQALTKTLDKSSPDVVHFRNLVGLSVKMIDACQKRGIPTVLTPHDHWGICFKSIMTKNDAAEAHGGQDLREILHRLAALEPRLEKRLLVCRMDLSDEETWRAAKLLLLPAAGREALSHALHAFQRQIPIVVPENVRQLKGLCLASNPGLFYQDLHELQECLHLLLSNEPLRQAMGMNGRNFVQSFRRATTMP